MTGIELEFHPIASIFPLMDGADFAGLRDDIAANGLREPIWLHEDKIVDGRNRYRACREVGIEPECREWDGEGDLTAFVVSLNLHRRHLSESQRAMVAGELANLSHGRHKDDRQICLSQPDAAGLLGVSVRSVKSAQHVQRSGTPDLVKAVKAGEIKVSAAVEVARLPTPIQEEVVARGPDAIKAKAVEVRAERTMDRLASDLATVEETHPSHADVGHVPLPGQQSFLEPDSSESEEDAFDPTAPPSIGGEEFARLLKKLSRNIDVVMGRRGGLGVMAANWSSDELSQISTVCSLIGKQISLLRSQTKEALRCRDKA